MSRSGYRACSYEDTWAGSRRPRAGDWIGTGDGDGCSGVSARCDGPPRGRDRRRDQEPNRSGRSARLWPSSPQLSPTRRDPARCVRPGGTLKRVHTEVPSGVAASNADDSRLPPPRSTLLSRHLRQVSDLPEVSAPPTHQPHERRLPAGITEREGIGIGTPGTLPAPIVKV
jgi:hypothetical protein